MLDRKRSLEAILELLDDLGINPPKDRDGRLLLYYKDGTRIELKITYEEIMRIRGLRLLNGEEEAG